MFCSREVRCGVMNQDYPLKMLLFGDFDVKVDGQPLPSLPGQTSKSLFAYLAVHHGRAVNKLTVMTDIWGPGEHSEALRQALTRLCRALGDLSRNIVSTRGQLQLVLRDGVDDVDVVRFNKATAAASQGNIDALREAIALYGRGPLLAGWGESNLRDSNEVIDRWVHGARKEYQRRYIDTLERFYAQAIQGDRYRDALLCLHGLVPTGVIKIEAWKAFVQRLIADREYEEAYDRCMELNKIVTLSALETRQILQGIPDERLERLEARHNLRYPPHDSEPIDILRQRIKLIGRDEDAHAIAEMLKEEYRRFIVLTGPGGIGKTSLATEVGHLVRLGIAEKVWFADGIKAIDLAPVTDPAAVATQICSVLRIRENSDQPDKQDALARWIGAQEILLILDNCEHLSDGCSELANHLLDNCPRLRILATSRRAFNTGETWAVSPLDLPPPSTPDTPEALRRYFAVQMFLECARPRTFALTSANARYVAELCRRLDGVPLMLKLAASRMDRLSPEGMLEHFRALLDFRTPGVEDKRYPERTPRAIINWSYGLLNDQEQELLSRLSAFAGGWTLKAAEQVCLGGDIEESHVLHLLIELVNVGLVEYDEGQSRYRLLELIREYAGEKLAENGEEERLVREKHRDYFMVLAETINRKLGGREQARCLDEMETEYANLKQALALCRNDPEGAEKGLRLGAALQEFWWVRGRYKEGSEYYAALLSHPQAQQRTKPRADVLNGAGALARMQGDYHAARNYHTESRDIFRELGDQRNIAYALSNLAIVVCELNEVDHARSLFEESLEIHRQLPNNDEGIAYCLGNFGRMAYYQNDYTAARSLFEESLGMLRALEHELGIANCLEHLGIISRHQGDYASACSFLRDSLILNQKLNNHPAILSCLESFADLACDEGEWARAVHLYGAAEKHRQNMDLPPTRSSNEKVEYDRHQMEAHQVLGEEAFCASWEEGRGLPLERAVKYALSGPDS